MPSIAEPLSPKNLSVAYSATEDRLIIIAADVDGLELGLLSTRRLTGRLINTLAATLEKSSTQAARAPADLRSDVVLLEHQGALGSQSPARTGEGGSPPSASVSNKSKLPSALITSVDIKLYPTHFGIIIKNGEQAMVQFSANRNELHRFLDILKAKAQEADWDIKVTATWLDPVQSGVTVN